MISRWLYVHQSCSINSCFDVFLIKPQFFFLSRSSTNDEYHQRFNAETPCFLHLFLGASDISGDPSNLWDSKTSVERGTAAASSWDSPWEGEIFWSQAGKMDAPNIHLRIMNLTLGFLCSNVDALESSIVRLNSKPPTKNRHVISSTTNTSSKNIQKQQNIINKNNKTWFTTPKTPRRICFCWGKILLPSADISKIRGVPGRWRAWREVALGTKLFLRSCVKIHGNFM